MAGPGGSLRIGLMLPQMGESFATTLKTAQRAEALGFDGAFLIDHLWPLIGREKPMPEAWTALSALTAMTSRIRLGTLVSRVTTRNPALLAKMAATVDEIGGGRLILGVGSGDDLNRRENEGYGLPFFGRQDRGSSLREYLQVIDLMWRENHPTFEGEYYHVHDAALLPKPVQQPRPPLWVGGRAAIVRQIAAEVADGWNAWSVSHEELASGIEEVRHLAERAGRDPDAQKHSWAGHVIVRERAEDAAAARGTLRTGDSLIKNVVSGTPDECVAQLDAFRQAGAAWVICDFSGPDRDATLEVFGERVLPQLHIAATNLSS